jgi:hypothetical protein
MSGLLFIVQALQRRQCVAPVQHVGARQIGAQAEVEAAFGRGQPVGARGFTVRRGVLYVQVRPPSASRRRPVLRSPMA